MVSRVLKYNPFRRIRGLYKTSQGLAGKKCFLDRHRDGLTYYNPTEMGERRNGASVFRGMGNQLLESGKFSSLTQIKFSEDPAQVRNFIRLIIRTSVSMDNAALASECEIEDISRYQPKLH